MKKGDRVRIVKQQDYFWADLNGMEGVITGKYGPFFFVRFDSGPPLKLFKPEELEVVDADTKGSD